MAAEGDELDGELSRALQSECLGVARQRSGSRTSSNRSGGRRSSNISPASRIFRNLLILEDSLRGQARRQRALRWQYTVFLSCLAGAAGFSAYELYLQPGGSLPRLYSLALQFMLTIIVVAVFLFNISGQYRRTIVSPRRFFASTNKALKPLHLRLVRVPRRWDDLVSDAVRLLGSYSAGLLLWVLRGRCRWVRFFWAHAQPRVGATDVKLVLSPRAFSAEVREGWEIYRDEFWAREGARRRRGRDGAGTTAGATASADGSSERTKH
ncbi:Nem1-Spo7 phosphatase regulatory subunit SPO7 KNAG_0D04710 [Huiozyma naganishii CBS 8797]|uniref:Spo7-like protein n=1 Tax=Huiozyma naganishii (strain ATCC MYA-139 / BCRC 22969 / CBS 8797 / KCTC 17520 / NBRC 10181 / NCYC 3082 / Yp74L-3) TaxID=1071383 RepID=J7S7A7_HUIN7|nr:hypothetical protein KNAG_0D04710 [Kazachstania naganishii CBS 8797]CCK70211.1 hypothetical protein KNAG_0D04710 [Kazachstania naganishii CBS 8797]